MGTEVCAIMKKVNSLVMNTKPRDEFTEKEFLRKGCTFGSDNLDNKTILQNTKTKKFFVNGFKHWYLIEQIEKQLRKRKYLNIFKVLLFLKQTEQVMRERL